MEQIISSSWGSEVYSKDTEIHEHCPRIFTQNTKTNLNFEIIKNLS